MTIAHQIENTKEIRSIMASLFYLYKETEKSGLTELSDILKNALHETNSWLEDKKLPAERLILDNRTLQLFEILFKATSMSPRQLEKFLSIVGDKDTPPSTILN
ncbi:MAG: hypothetical protein H6868_02975 [Rhodospirillales bacterium]|nr:hypothetical protein [Rhodospirillales bacterium]